MHDCLLLGNEVELGMGPLTPPTPQHAAGADRDLSLGQVVAHLLVHALGVDEDLQMVSLVVLVRAQAEDGGHPNGAKQQHHHHVLGPDTTNQLGRYAASTTSTAKNYVKYELGLSETFVSLIRICFLRYSTKTYSQK